MKRNRDFHRHVRVVYRACRKIYGIERTQDECLKVFKVVFPELYRLGDTNYTSDTESVRLKISKIVEQWHPTGILKELTDRIDSFLCIPFGGSSEELIQFYVDILPVIMRIRKLTPRECGRLQGCDEKTIDIIESCGVSRSAQYKMYGNSITVDVLYHIFRKMFVNTEPERVKGQPVQMSLF